MVEYEFKDRYGIEDLREIVRLLRSPGGCPWDKEQDHQSIRTCIESIRTFCNTWSILAVLARDRNIVYFHFIVCTIFDLIHTHQVHTFCGCCT